MRPAIVLATTIAAAALAGTAISLAQRPPAPRHPTIAASPDISAIPPTNQPAVAFGFSVAPDLQRHQLVLFGGVGDFSNTWLWDGAAWSRAQPAMSPPGRYGASAAFDPQIGAVLLFGGILQTGQTANDTWAWDGRTWQEVDTGRDGPGGGAASAMAWDPSRSEMVLVAPSPGGGGGGQTWTWSGTRWVHDRAGVLGTRDTGILMAFDPVSNALIAEGCCASPTAGTLGGVPSTWRWMVPRGACSRLQCAHPMGPAWDSTHHCGVWCSAGAISPAGWRRGCGCGMGGTGCPGPTRVSRSRLRPRSSIPPIRSSWCSARRSAALTR